MTYEQYKNNIIELGELSQYQKTPDLMTHLNNLKEDIYLFRKEQPLLAHRYDERMRREASNYKG
jgi:hypothetical protein